MGINEFIDYCDRNANGESNSINADNHNHAGLCKLIYNNPETMGPREVTKKWREVDLGIGGAEGRLDLVFLDQYDETYLVECKTKLSHPLNEASRQLKRGFYFMNKNFQVTPILIGVSRPPQRKIRIVRIQPQVKDFLSY